MGQLKLSAKAISADSSRKVWVDFIFCSDSHSRLVLDAKEEGRKAHLIREAPLIPAHLDAPQGEDKELNTEELSGPETGGVRMKCDNSITAHAQIFVCAAFSISCFCCNCSS